jgi:flagellar motor switch protein FliN/FliY
MPEMTQDSILNFGGLQGQIWGTVETTVSEAAGCEVSFANPRTDHVAPSALFAETTEPKVVVQFSFSDMPDSTQVVLVQAETAAALASAVRGADPGEVNDALVGEMRPVFEAIVQGICLAVGKLHNGTVVASGLSIRLQNLAFPLNIQNSDAVFFTVCDAKVEDHAGRIVWLADPETARMVLGLEPEEEPVKRSTNKPAVGNEESLEILMDIPLQISVELGRVKMVVKDVVELGSGSIIEIDKAAGEPVDVLVNGKVVARGEVVVIEDNFGVRITEILSQQDRLAKLKEAA